MGDPELDHQCWERPEAIRGIRPLTQVNTSFPGTEVAAETAAAMASASLVFKKIDSSYSNLLLEHAQQLFSFADAYRGSYSVSIPQVQNYYNSTGYEDELLWAASWLYHASKDLVGYGSNYPQNVHHRGASIPVDANTTCKDGFTWLDSINPNPNVAVGAVVGGPFLNETYIDSRNNWMQAEPTTYNSALVVSLLSSLVRSSSVVDSFT